MIRMLGTKLGMTRVFDAAGDSVPVTVIQVGPCKVVDVRSKEKNGYNAVQLGYGTRKEKTLNKAEAGYFKKRNVEPQGHLEESRVPDSSVYQIGQVLDVGIFEGIHYVDVTGVSIGKGFQGPVKRWRFKGGPGGHGSNFHRRQGSIGSNTDPARVFKGMKMAGRMGGVQRTAMSLQVIQTDKENNVILIKGSVPGNDNEIVSVRKSLKRGDHKPNVAKHIAKKVDKPEKAEKPAAKK